MKFLNKNRALTASLDSLINARSFLEKLIDIKTNAQLHADYEQSIAQASNKICGDNALVFCSKQYVSSIDNQTYYCLLTVNHSGDCGYSITEIHQRIKEINENTK